MKKNKIHPSFTKTSLAAWRWLAAVPLSVLFILCFIPLAQSADAFHRNIIGFSADGRWFAFEQFGSQDGSGFPEATLFVLDTAKDRWAKSTPIRAELEDENKSEYHALDIVRARGARILRQKRIKYPGHLLASKPLTSNPEPVHSITFQTAYPHGQHIHLNLVVTPVGMLESCVVEPASRLALSIGRPSEAKTIVYHDS